MSDVIDRLNKSLANRYTVERMIARGAMATVYLAVDEKHKRQVALKVVLPDIAASLSARRFLREIEIAAHLAHPNIVALLDSGHADGFLYHVTQYMEGETLADRLKRDHQLPIPECARIVREVADALDYAHSEGVIHRDVKPANIVLSKNHAMVVDFGVARAIDIGGGERLTQTGIVLGTPAYMSPEQASGDRSLDGRSDTYSLGCVAFEMMCGEPPLIGRSSRTTIARRLNESPASICTIRETVSPRMEAVVHRALSRFPADRFQRARDFGEAMTLALSMTSSATPLPGELPFPVSAGEATDLGSTPGKPSFWSELKRRKVYTVGTIYVVFAVAVLGVADATFEPLGLSDSAMRLLIYAAIAGFPLTLFLAWVFEVTSEGIRRTRSIDMRR